MILRRINFAMRNRIGNRQCVTWILWLVIAVLSAHSQAAALPDKRVSFPINHPQTACIEVPTLTNCQGEGATIYPWITLWDVCVNCEFQPIPEAIQAVLRDLPEEQVKLPKGLRAEYAEQNAMLLAVDGFGEESDYLVFQYGVDPDLSVYTNQLHFWLRSFEGKQPKDTVYLVGMTADCLVIEDYFSRHPEEKMQHDYSCQKRRQTNQQIAGSWFIEAIPENWQLEKDDWPRQRREISHNAYAYQLRAYRRDEQGQLQEVTKEVLPPLSVLALSEEQLTEYWHHGFSGVFLDHQFLLHQPQFEWAAYFDQKYDNALIKSLISLGHVVWNGKDFQFKAYISPTSLPIKELDKWWIDVMKDRFILQY